MNSDKIQQLEEALANAASASDGAADAPDGAAMERVLLDNDSKWREELAEMAKAKDECDAAARELASKYEAVQLEALNAEAEHAQALQVSHVCF